MLAVPIAATYFLSEKAFREQEYRQLYIETVNSTNLRGNSNMTRSSIACLTLLAALLAGTAAQAQAPLPAFEVASIRLAKPFAQAVAEGSLIGMAVDPGRIRIGQMPLQKLIRTAYGIGLAQRTGPDWRVVDFRMFDIEAKLPAGATADQIPLMLQSLLADRFKLIVTRGTREVDTYALLVGKDGPKLQAKDSPAGPADNFTSQSRAIAVGDGQKGEMILDVGSYKTTTVPGVVVRVETSTIAGLVEYLSSGTSGVGTPVIDKTGLKGDFDIKLEVLMAELSAALRAGAPKAPEPGDPAAAGAYLNALTEFMDGQSDARRKPVLAAVEKLGLKLEKQKNPIPTLVVVHMEKNPTDN